MAAERVTATTQLEPDDDDDVAAARDGDRGAFARLVARHDDALLLLATRLLGDLRAAEDARQAAWLRIWRGLPAFDRHARFRTWAWRIVVNGCRDVQRRAATRLQDQGEPLSAAAALPDPAPDPATVIALGEAAAEVRAALRELPEDERECLVLRHWHDLAPAEIAAVVGRPRTTVQSCLARALTRLALKLRARGAIDDRAPRVSHERQGGER